MLTFFDWLNEENIFGKQRAKELRQVLKNAGMPKKKRAHSERVTQDVHSLFQSLDLNRWTAVMAALFHDFLERGGDHHVLYQLNLPPQAIQVINALTSDKGNADPLGHLQGVLFNLEPNLKNIVILVKLSDRIDNLRKRKLAGGISKKYWQKSSNLVNWLFQQYTGNPEYILILQKRLRKLL